MRSGSLLENNVEKVFQKAGFETERNIKILDYEVDVFAKYKEHEIIIECKERSRGGIIPRNIIHEWASKKNILSADRFLIVFYGIDVSDEDRELAEENDLYVWDTSDFEEFFDKMMEKEKNLLVDILDNLNITTKEVERKRKLIEKMRREEERSIKEQKEKWKPDKDYWRFILKEYEERRKWHTHDELMICGMDEDIRGPLLNMYDDDMNLDIEASIEKLKGSDLENMFLIFPRISIGKRDVEIAEKYGFKYIVCEKIRNKGLFTPEITQEETKVKIITYSELKSLANR